LTGLNGVEGFAQLRNEWEQSRKSIAGRMEGDNREARWNGLLNSKEPVDGDEHVALPRGER